MTSLKNLANLSATQAAKALAQREIKAEDLLNDCLNQIGIREPEVHAWVSFAKIHAQTQARELDRGPIQGILHGLPIGVKDLFDTHDLPTNYGSPIYGNNHPICDAVSVSLMQCAAVMRMRLRQRDAVQSPSGIWIATAADASGDPGVPPMT